MNNPQSKRGPYRKSLERRAEILHAALASMAEHGYERASLRDIASRAGITHAGVLHHFADKEDVLRAALSYVEEEELSAGLSAGQAGASVGEITVEMLRRALSTPERTRDWLALNIAATRPDHAAHDFFAQRRQRALSVLGAEATTAADGKQLTAQARATLLIAVMDGLQIQGLQDPDAEVVAALARFLDLLVPSQGSPSAPGVGTGRGGRPGKAGDSGALTAGQGPPDPADSPAISAQGETQPHTMN